MKYIFIAVLILIILYVYKNKNIKETFNNLLTPSYVPNVPVINQKHITPSFNIDLQCKDKNMKQYIGWKCYVRDHFSKMDIKEKTDWSGTVFSNYLKNTPLRFDGVWKESLKNKNYIWEV